MKTFNVYEQYLAENEAQAQKSAAYKAHVDQARAAVAAARIKADEVIHSEVASGVDKSSEKVAARKVIEKAEQALANALAEQSAASAFMTNNPAATRDADVVQAWLTDYRPAVQAEHLPSIQERVKVGQELLLSALHDFQSLKREYDGITEEIQHLNDKAKQSGRQRDYYAITNPMNDLTATGFNASNLSKMLDDVLRGAALPAGIEYHGEVK